MTSQSLLHKKICWVLFDAEKKGSENQSKHLAERLKIKTILCKPIIKPRGLLYIVPRFFWKFFYTV